MKAKIGCFTLPYRKFALADALAGIRSAGFEHVGVWPEDASGPLLDSESGSTKTAELGRRIADAGLRPSVLFGRVCPLDDESERNFIVRLDQAAELGVDEVLSIAPWPYAQGIDVPRPADEWAAEVERFYRHLAPVARHAEEIGMTIAYKPHTGLTATAAECRQLVERAGSPRVRISYDPGNVSFYEGVRPEGDLPKIADSVVSICVKDHVGGRGEAGFPNPGTGDVDWQAIFGVLAEHGFSGPATVEKLAGAEIDEINASAAETAGFLAGLVAGI
jgi:sugar phosphate isomerase/epimerase